MGDSDSDSDSELLMMLILNRHDKRQQKRKAWVHEILQQREKLGKFHRLVKELSSHEDKNFLSTSEYQKAAQISKLLCRLSWSQRM